MADQVADLAGLVSSAILGSRRARASTVKPAQSAPAEAVGRAAVTGEDLAVTAVARVVGAVCLSKGPSNCWPWACWQSVRAMATT